LTLNPILSALLLSWLAANASAQVLFPSTGSGPPPPVTPVASKWDRLDKDTYFYIGGQKDGPLILSVPDAPGDGLGGFNDYLERYLVDQGYAVGVLDWRGDYSRTATPSSIVTRAFADLARLRVRNQVRFDPNRIVLFGAGESAFLGMLLSADSHRLQAAGISPKSICATILLHPMDLDASNPDSYLARRQFSAEPASVTDISPLDYAASAPPQLILTEEGDRADEKRGDTAAAALKTAGSTVFQTSYAQFDVNNERTYLGWITNPATLKLGEFLRTYCPARKS
jgi:hypothetical protein